MQITIVLLWLLSRRDVPEIVEPSLILLHPKVKPKWNFCDELREIKEDPSSSLDSMLLKDLQIRAADLLDSQSYENLFKRVYQYPATDTPTRQYADRTIRGIEGERNRRQAAHLKQAHGRI